MRFYKTKDFLKLGLATVTAGAYVLHQGPLLDRYVNYKKSGSFLSYFKQPQPLPGTVK